MGCERSRARGKMKCPQCQTSIIQTEYPFQRNRLQRRRDCCRRDLLGVRKNNYRDYCRSTIDRHKKRLLSFRFLASSHSSWPYEAKLLSQTLATTLVRTVRTERCTTQT